MHFEFFDCRVACYALNSTQITILKIEDSNSNSQTTSFREYHKNIELNNTAQNRQSQTYNKLEFVNEGVHDLFDRQLILYNESSPFPVFHTGRSN